jgi:2-methylcitrate dehydratase PrpD
MSAIDEIAVHLAKVTFEDIPGATVERQKELIVDTLGVAAAGARAPGVKDVLEFVKDSGGNPESSLLMDGGKVPCSSATLANAFMMHALDFDDMHEAAGLHANVCVLPAALAAAEKMGTVDGRNLLTAVILGVDLVCRMGVSIPLLRGWHPTATFGIFGAAAASGKILGLDERRTANAMGIAYSQSSGNRQGRLEGTMTKRLQVALSAKSGVLSSLFAQRNLTGPHRIFEGDWGMLNLYTPPQTQENREKVIHHLTKNLGKAFLGDELSVKPYPSCKATHTPIFSMLNLMKEEGLRPEQIEGVEVAVSKGCYQTAGRPFEIRTDPQVDAQFSIPYTVATAVLKGKVGLDDFTESAVKEPERLSMAGRVKVSVNPELQEPSTNVVNLASAIRVRAGGRTFSRSAATSKGHPGNPMSREELFTKFESCLRFGTTLSFKKIESVFEMILNMEKLENVNGLVEAFS